MHNDLPLDSHSRRVFLKRMAVASGSVLIEGRRCRGLGDYRQPLNASSKGRGVMRLQGKVAEEELWVGVRVAEAEAPQEDERIPPDSWPGVTEANAEAQAAQVQQ